MVDLNYVALVLQQAQQTLEAADAGLRKHVPERYRRMILGANHYAEVAGIVDRCRQYVPDGGDPEPPSGRACANCSGSGVWEEEDHQCACGFCAGTGRVPAND